MTYNEIFEKNNITLFTEYSGFTAQEAIAKIQSDSEKSKTFIYCSNINCSGISCLDCLINSSNVDKLLLWLQQFVSKPDTITYFNNEEFEEGDLVIVTEFEGNPDYTTIGNCINNGEIIRLGGKYWSSNSPLKLKNGEEIMGRTIKYPLGNSTVLWEPEKIKIRHATPEEIAYYNKVGLGANINDMKKEETILTITQPEPKFKVGDIVTFKDRKDCKSEDGKIKMYWFGGENYGGKKVPVTKVLDFVPVKNCYKIEVNINHTNIYWMLECEFQEYDSVIEAPKIPVKVNCTNSLQRKFYLQEGRTDLSITPEGIPFQKYLRKTNSIEKWVEYQKTIFSIGKYIVLNKSVGCIPDVKVPLRICAYGRGAYGPLILKLNTIPITRGLGQIIIGDIIDSDYTLFNTLEEAQDYCGIAKPLVESFPVFPEYCMIQTTKSKIIFKNLKQLGPNNFSRECGINITTKTYLTELHSTSFLLSIVSNRAATPSEIYWLNKCMKLKRFLPLVNPEFSEGDLVVIENTNWDWFEPGEVVCLGGKYWNETRPIQIQLGDGIAAISLKYPKGNGTTSVLSTPLSSDFKCRLATPEEIATSQWVKPGTPFDVTQPYLLLREQLTDKENIVDTYQFIPSKLPQFPQQKNKYIIEIQEEESIFLGSKPTFKQLIK